MLPELLCVIKEHGSIIGIKIIKKKKLYNYKFKDPPHTLFSFRVRRFISENTQFFCSEENHIVNGFLISKIYIFFLLLLPPFGSNILKVFSVDWNFCHQT